MAFPRWYVAAPAYAWAAAVGFSRIYLGVHFLTDVLGGVVLGIGTGLLVWKLDEYFLRQ
jgi:undecaprenyl-diphosphatase